jgi:SulP family sulfate permease
MQLWQQYRRQRSATLDDLLAGATGAMVGIPQAMGFAIIAGISPIYGLYAAMIAPVIGALAGSSVYMTVAPTNALALVVGSRLMQFDEAGQIERLFVLTLLVGVFQLVFGLLRLGELARFVSNAVMTGFITGAGILIILGQLHHLTGYAAASGASVLSGFEEWLVNLYRSDLRTTVVGIVTIVLILALKQTRAKNAAALIAITLISGLVALAGWHGVEIVGDISSIPGKLPTPGLPDFAYARDMLIAALAVAVLASVQSVAITNNFAERQEPSPDLNRDLAAQGLANIAGGVLQGMPAGGSLSRTAVNVSAGARTRLANIFSGVLVMVGVLVFAPMLGKVALAALAGHLIVAASEVIRLRIVILVWRVNWSARLVMAITFASTLALPLEYSVYIGVLLSLALYVYSSANNIHVVRLVTNGNHHFREAEVPHHLPSAEPVVLSVSGNLYFAAVKHLQELMPSAEGVDRPVVILRLRDNQYLGSTGIQFLEAYDRQLRAHGGRLILTGVGHKIEDELVRTDMLGRFGQERIFRAEEYVFEATEHALDYARAWLRALDNGSAG